MSWLFPSGGQSIGASASIFPMSIQGWFSLGLISLISLLSKGLSRVFSSTTIWKHNSFFITQPCLFLFLSLAMCDHQNSASATPEFSMKRGKWTFGSYDVSWSVTCSLILLPSSPNLEEQRRTPHWEDSGDTTEHRSETNISVARKERPHKGESEADLLQRFPDSGGRSRCLGRWILSLVGNWVKARLSVWVDLSRISLPWREDTCTTRLCLGGCELLI